MVGVTGAAVAVTAEVIDDAAVAAFDEDEATTTAGVDEAEADVTATEEVEAAPDDAVSMQT